MNLDRLSAIFPSRLTLAAVVGCLIFIPLAIWLGWTGGVAEHDRRQAQAAADAYHAQIADPTTGYAARLGRCAASLSGAEAAVNRQSEAVRDLQKTAAEDAARAERLVQAAQAQAIAADRRARAVLQAQPRDGESRCDAAFRLHQEALS
ncbi:MAG: hypothetical protein P0Y50_08875 [Candidatus Brevundimonas colombiensis]|uniref:Uncharacterized protein n=1 Tax=Candidatus Brevundimonas colombiensis TaxID=3121376 RepID=A0AAJ5WXM8_9CAUL|nr:hypothetical protein [Brevundimonas sp.]WEK38665.1 MAG: hypothetical protein P0Y50_08875 [Brevundimonas sp.]